MKLITHMDPLISHYGERLNNLVGQSIESSQVIWYDPGDMIHAGSPVVFRTGEEQLELWTIYVKEFAISFNSLGLTLPPFYWTGKPDQESYWVEDAQLPLKKAKGKTITSIRLMACDRTCIGIQFSLNEGSLTVCNYSDDLLITDAPDLLSDEIEFVNII